MSEQKSSILRVNSLTFANLRFREISALRYKSFSVSGKWLKNHGEGGIRTLGTL
jgi:hypothetical protein